ncbi:GGDEF domain-containing protein [Oceanotoga teriensis]|uniref:GGDEF domain-containing protein n=1 Tax=Oceanotoga teriensis TaxID=515440 RepID=UPI0027134AF2|nr:GGDEF domain-containing protein [Oceanotoga teriensis]MDO7975321.1 GGDEF domain-containing protein [Oceanotoga teriensis]
MSKFSLQNIFMKKFIFTFIIIYIIIISIMTLIINYFFDYKILPSMENEIMYSLNVYINQLENTLYSNDEKYYIISKAILNHLTELNSTNIENNIKKFESIKNDYITPDITNINYYIINNDGIIIQTDYTNDLNMDLKSKYPEMMNSILKLETNKYNIQKTNFFIDFNKTRFYSFLRISEDFIFEIGIEISDSFIENFLNQFSIDNKEKSYVKKINIFNKYYKSYIDDNYATIEDKNSFFNIKDSDNFFILRKNNNINSIYRAFKLNKENSFDYDYNFLIKLDMDFNEISKYKSYLCLLFIIISIIVLFIMYTIQTKNLKMLIKPLKLLHENIIHKEKIIKAPKVKIKEIDDIIYSYNDLIDKLKKDMNLVMELNKKLSYNIRQKEIAEIKLLKLASKDDLTNTYNRRKCFEFIKDHIKLSNQKDTMFSLIFIDLDKLKSVNDNYGHSEGDKYLLNISKAIKYSLGKDDILCRFGGDEFIIIINSSDFYYIDKTLDLIKENASKIKLKNNLRYDLEFSFGISIYKPNEGLNAQDLIDLADERMYINKKSKKLDL